VCSVRHLFTLCMCRLSLLEQLLRGCRDTAQLQRQLQDNFPAEAAEEQLREYQEKALRGLGPTTLQVRGPCVSLAALGLAGMQCCKGWVAQVPRESPEGAAANNTAGTTHRSLLWPLVWLACNVAWGGLRSVC
jgi:hypothetical protein